MSETKEPEDNAGTERKTVTLSLKRTVDAGHVRQNFSHGRSKSVVVEKKKRRTIQTPGTVAARPAAKAAPVEPEVPEAPAAKTPVVEKKRPRRRSNALNPTSSPTERGGDSLTRKLSDAEKDLRLQALAAAKIREVEEKQKAEEDAVRRAQEDKQRAVQEAAAREEAEAEARRQAEADAYAGKVTGKAKSEAPGAEASAPTPAEIDPLPDPAMVAEKRGTDRAPADARKRTPSRPDQQQRPTPKRNEGRGRGRLTINNAFDDRQRERSLASLRRRQQRQKSRSQGVQTPREKISREVVIPEIITIQELANRMTERAVDIIRFLMKQGDMYKMNDVIDTDTAELIAQEFGHTVKRVSEADVEEGFIGGDDDDADLQSRPPVVTIMGHVDHGKTSLLDALRGANVVEGEAGGITQHIGAYQITTKSGSVITFIDTPGHEAFTAMRARGAKVTDIVVLVVAADDGVMPQTVEAIRHAKEADVPIIVAINKIDKPNSEPNRVRTDLLQHEIVVESMSGEVLEVEVSALKKLGLDNLLEAIAMQAELLELKANPNRDAEGIVVEAKLERGRGPVGTVLVQRGTLKVGNVMVAGTAWGRVRALLDDQGDNVVSARPSVPVEVLGFSSAPEAGDLFAVVENEARARELTEYRERVRRDNLGVAAGAVRTLEEMMSQLKEEGKQEFPLLIKADVQGSTEAITGALEKLGNDEVTARIIHSAVGGVSESDVALAAASNAVIMAFNVRANQQARQAAERDHVEIRQYAVIYDVVDDVKAAMSGMLAPTIREHFLGNAKILEIFNITKVGKVAGCQVTEGRVERGANVRLIRDNIVIHEGKLSTLKRFKDEVKEVQTGQECGMAFEKYQDMRADDVIECFTTEEIQRSL